MVFLQGEWSKGQLKVIPLESPKLLTAAKTINNSSVMLSVIMGQNHLQNYCQLQCVQWCTLYTHVIFTPVNVSTDIYFNTFFFLITLNYWEFNTFYMKFWHFSATLYCQKSYITTFMNLR